MLVSRNISGVLKDPNGSLLTSRQIIFTPISAFGDGGVLISQPEVVTTDPGTAAYSVDLYTKDTGSVKYQCNIDKFAFIFDLVAGNPTSLDAILNGEPSTGIPSDAVLFGPDTVDFGSEGVLFG